MFVGVVLLCCFLLLLLVVLCGLGLLVPDVGLGFVVMLCFPACPVCFLG